MEGMDRRSSDIPTPPPLVASAGSDLPPLGAYAYAEDSETDSEPDLVALMHVGFAVVDLFGGVGTV